VATTTRARGGLWVAFIALVRWLGLRGRSSAGDKGNESPVVIDRVRQSRPAHVGHSRTRASVRFTLGKALHCVARVLSKPGAIQGFVEATHPPSLPPPTKNGALAMTEC
jgi:hypothetical protein